MILANGIFTISLDFELHWGVFPTKTVKDYEHNLKGTKQAIEGILQLFGENKIHATWATVGLLFLENQKELNQWLPLKGITYDDPKFNPRKVAGNFPSDYQGAFHFAKDLIQQISQTPHQEIATHTFSHFYCLEKGQTAEQFKADLIAAIKIGQLNNTEIKSIVFPRNQFNESYTSICKELNINTLRSNPTHFLYQPRNKKTDNKKWLRAGRLIDTYLNLSGQQAGAPFIKNEVLHIPASRFLRPYAPKLAVLEKLKLARIKKEMTIAAQQKKCYHLWWHPHNFGIYTKENLQLLQAILTHYQKLEKQYGFQSLNMREIGELYGK